MARLTPMRYVVIMAGGSGTRLWPLSRQGEPKQLLPLIEGRSLLRMAYDRVAGVVPEQNILICSGAAHADQIFAQIPELAPENLLGEPEGRDSMNAVAWTAAVLQRRDPQAVVAMLSSDHIMRPERVFRERLLEAFDLAQADPEALVTFGVVPTSPQTGFGYLHRGPSVSGNACAVTEFAEKPALALAQSYLASGEYWWNSGMFVWQASALLAALAVALPQTHAQVLDLAAHPERLAEIYPQLHKVSVDYGVMEPVSAGQAPGHVLAVELPIEWHDVGTFLALAGQLPATTQGNAVQGQVVALDAYGNLLINRRGDDHVVAVTGLRSMAVVTTDHATLVAPLADADKVKPLVALVAEQAGPQFA